MKIDITVFVLQSLRRDYPSKHTLAQLTQDSICFDIMIIIIDKLSFLLSLSYIKDCHLQ